MGPSLSSCLYSPNLVEGRFSEVVPQGVLESSGSPATALLSTPLRGLRRDTEALVRRVFGAEFSLIAYLGRSFSAVEEPRFSTSSQ
jgi:hypothetical protein